MASLHTFAQTPIQNARAPAEVAQLQDLWRNAPCVLFFLRRLGCALCRTYIAGIEAVRAEYEKTGARLVCLSFESLGEGSDSDRSFEAGGYWKGELYTIPKPVYNDLFGRKGLTDGFYGLLDMNKEAYAAAKHTPGNLKGDGFQLGGQFVVAKGGKVVLEHRQKRYGDDAKPALLWATLMEAPSASE
jgi:prostamide/prostaglandin F2alpha synthase